MSRRLCDLQNTIGYVVNNFELFGFGSASDALLQATKELVENSIDACTSPCEIRVTISATEDGLVLDVLDNGCGVADPALFLRCFYTTKRSDLASADDMHSTAGKYGMGLTTCLLYTQEMCQHPLSIVTKTAHQEHAIAADILFDANTCDPKLINVSAIHSPGLISGTRLSLCLPPVEDEDEVSYLSKYSLHKFESLKIDMTFLGHHYDFPINKTPTHLPDTSSTETNGVDDIVVKIDLELLTEQMSPDEHEPEVSSKTIIVRIERYANSIPLLDISTDIGGCLMYRAVRNFTWSAFGHRMRDCENNDENMVGELLSVCEEAEWKRVLTVTVNLIMPSVPYSNMRKTAISKSNILQKTIHEGLSKAMKRLHRKLGPSSPFLAKAEYHRRRILSHHIPSVAVSLARIMAVASDDVQDQVRSLLPGLRSTNIDAVSKHLQEEMTDIVTHY